MREKIKKISISWSIGAVILLFSWYLLQQILADKGPGSLWFLIIVLFIFCIGMVFFIGPFEDTKLGKILLMFFGGVLSFIIRTIDFSQIVIIPLFSFMSILSIQIVIWKLINLFYTFNNQHLISAYFIALITLLIFAYRSSALITFFFKLFSSFELRLSDKWKINWINTAFNVTFFRKRAYELSILLTIVSSIEKFSEAPLVNNLLWINYSKVSFEVLVAFVAIDAYLQTFIKNGEVSMSIK